MRTNKEMAAYQRERRKRLKLKEMEPFEVRDLRGLKCFGCIDKEKEIELLMARVALFESSYGK
jgi:hypothetical protein